MPIDSKELLSNPLHVYPVANKYTGDHLYPGAIMATSSGADLESIVLTLIDDIGIGRCSQAQALSRLADIAHLAKKGKDRENSPSLTFEDAFLMRETARREGMDQARADLRVGLDSAIAIWREKADKQDISEPAHIRQSYALIARELEKVAKTLTL